MTERALHPVVYWTYNAYGGTTYVGHKLRGDLLIKSPVTAVGPASRSPHRAAAALSSSQTPAGPGAVRRYARRMPEPARPKWSNAPFTPQERAYCSHRREEAQPATGGCERRTECAKRSFAATQPAGIFEAVFWIRLYGCITDLHERFQRWTDAHVGEDPSWPPYCFLAAYSEVAASCRALRESLSDEETVYVAFVRRLHAHVYQEGFEPAIEPGNAATGQRGRVRTKQKVRPLGIDIDIETAHSIVDRVHLAHGTDERAIALTFAQKVAEPLRRLQRAMEKLRAAREVPDEA